MYVARQLGHDARLTLTTYGHVIDELDDAPRLTADDAMRAARQRSCARVRMPTKLQSTPAECTKPASALRCGTRSDGARGTRTPDLLGAIQHGQNPFRRVCRVISSEGAGPCRTRLPRSLRLLPPGSVQRIVSLADPPRCHGPCGAKDRDRGRADVPRGEPTAVPRPRARSGARRRRRSAAALRRGAERHQQDEQCRDRHALAFRLRRSSASETGSRRAGRARVRRGSSPSRRRAAPRVARR